MGGSGSGRWGWYRARRTVEQSIVLDIRKVYGDMIPREYFQQRRRWTRQFSFPFMGRNIELTHWDLSWDQPYASLTLSKTYGHGDTPRNDIQQIQLTSTVCNYGRERWWFICPSCQRRCACLYMVGESRFRRCRKCWNLTYRSAQQAHESDRGRPLFGIDLAFWNREMRNERLAERWCKKEHMTKGERRKIAAYLGLPLFMIRNYFYKRSTRLKMLAASPKVNTST